MTSGHNKGPIGPLDPNEPPPLEPEIRREDEIGADYAVMLLRSMGVEVSVKDLEYWHASNEGPMYRQMYEPPKLYRWGDVQDWAARTPPVPKLNRKQAEEYTRSLGDHVTPHTLPQLMYLAQGPRLPFERRGRGVYYAPEDCEKRVEEIKAWGPRHSTAPKFNKPRNARRHCPQNYKDCPNVPHEKCAKYARALCNFTHLPDRRGD